MAAMVVVVVVGDLADVVNMHTRPQNFAIVIKFILGLTIFVSFFFTIYTWPYA